MRRSRLKSWDYSVFKACNYQASPVRACNFYYGRCKFSVISLERLDNERFDFKRRSSAQSATGGLQVPRPSITDHGTNYRLLQDSLDNYRLWIHHNPKTFDRNLRTTISSNQALCKYAGASVVAAARMDSTQPRLFRGRPTWIGRLAWDVITRVVWDQAVEWVEICNRVWI